MSPGVPAGGGETLLIVDAPGLEPLRTLARLCADGSYRVLALEEHAGDADDDSVLFVDAAALARPEMQELVGRWRAAGRPVIAYCPDHRSPAALSALHAGADELLHLDDLDPDGLRHHIRVALARRDGAAPTFSRAIDAAEVTLWEWDVATGDLRLSGHWHRLIGAGEESTSVKVQIEEWLNRVHPGDREAFRETLQHHLRGESEHFVTQHRLRHERAGYRWVEARGAGTDVGGGRLVLAGALHDVEERRRREKELTRAALHDDLTRLPNRSLFLDRLGRAIERARRRPDQRFAVLFLDLDRFKAINDSLGHSVGDRLLRATADRLRDLLRPRDWVARIGGDEFALLVDDLAEAADATRVARRVLHDLARPHHIEGREIHVTASIGVALSAAGYEDPLDLLRDADNAMYRSKSMGRARYQLFDPTLHETAMRQLALENELRRATLRSELELAYQPIVRLTDGRIRGLEALVRWRHPERGLLLPQEFIDIAEETGTIHEIGDRVLDDACARAAEWQRRFPSARPLTMSVNVSGREFLEDDLVRRVRHALFHHEILPGTLHLELTETSLVEHPETARRRIEDLRELDVGVHLDDFGTGYCSLSYLQKLPTETLKIDRSFIHQIQASDAPGHILETIVALAHGLGIGLSAEGLETATQVSALRSLSCELGQGYFFSEPVAEADVPLLLRDGHLTGVN